jgi:hypothetical protein
MNMTSDTPTTRREFLKTSALVGSGGCYDLAQRLTKILAT